MGNGADRVQLAGSLLTACLILACTVSRAGDSAPGLRKAETHHATKIAGANVQYLAKVEEFAVMDPAGRPGASVVTIAYVRERVANRTRRPVIFAFNGGPGASSSPLHMKAMGPVMRTPSSPEDRSATKLAPNPDSPLDVADLVFIDPVSTGFSRAWPEVDPKPWYDNFFDAETVASVIQQWLAANRRETSPRFLMGESYGTMRAGLLVQRIPHLRFDGVLLVSGPSTTDGAGPDLAFVVSIPSMAAGAWYHQRVDRRGLSSAQFFGEAMKFARGPYADALARDGVLAAVEKQRIAEQLSAYIGLPASLILEKDLRIDANTWMFNLLKDQGLRTGRLDVRVTGPLQPGQDGAIDDPALGVVKASKTPAPPPTPASIGPVESPVVGKYLVEQLRFKSSDPYYGVNFLANSQWVFHPNAGTEANVALAMKNDPRLRLFVTAGYFDFGATDGATFVEAGVPTDRFEFVPLAGPHEVYDGDENRAAFNAAVRRFVQGAKP